MEEHNAPRCDTNDRPLRLVEFPADDGPPGRTNWLTDERLINCSTAAQLLHLRAVLYLDGTRRPNPIPAERVDFSDLLAVGLCEQHDMEALAMELVVAGLWGVVMWGGQNDDDGHVTNLTGYLIDTVPSLSGTPSWEG